MRRRPFPSPLLIWLKRRRRDRTAPTLSSAVIDAAGTTLTLTFSESVSGVSAADFALSTGQALSSATGAGTSWALTTEQVYDDETPTLAYSGSSVEDESGNALVAFTGAAVTNNSAVSSDSTAPTLANATTGTTGLSTVMVFSESVTGVQAADFALSTGQAISGVSGSGDTWTLTHAQVYQGETPTLAYSGAAVEDAAGNALAVFAGTAITNNSTVPQTGTLQVDLAAFWALEEASGQRQDSHTNALHLTDNNTVTQAAGKVGNAANFVAANSEYLSIADNAPLSMGNNAMTFAFWVRRSGSERWIFSKTDNSFAGEYQCWINGSSQLEFQCLRSTGSVAANVNSGLIPANTWTFCVVYHDPVTDVIGLQVNNGTPVTAAFAGGANDSTFPFVLGARNGTSNYFEGQLDQVGVWRRLLTSAEKTYLYNSGNGRTYAEVLAASP